MKRVFIAGGAGFIGSHLVDKLLALAELEAVTVFDNFSSGQREFLDHHSKNPKFFCQAGAIESSDALITSMKGHDTVIHLASNPDIARAAQEPSIDFDQGTFLTHRIIEAARINLVKTLLYVSGSGVYGDRGDEQSKEDAGRLLPISTYGASKLAGEAMICAYAHMYGFKAIAFRCANIVGKRQTHGVVLDFIKKLKQDQHTLNILGDGNQRKSYIHVSDVINGMLLADAKSTKAFEVYNVATSDYISVREIADMVVEKTVGQGAQVEYAYSGGSRGWQGDVPVVRLNTEKIRSLGWLPSLNSSREAIELAIAENLDQT